MLHIPSQFTAAPPLPALTSPDTAYIPADPLYTEIFQILDRLEETMTNRGWGDEKSDADFARIAEIIETLQHAHHPTDDAESC